MTSMTAPHPQTWLDVRPEGLFVRPGGFFVDPLRPVDLAVVTHGHSDHARPGHGTVIATAETLAIMPVRLGEDAGRRAATAGLRRDRSALGEVTVWLAPAGHVLGSAQVVMEYGVRAWSIRRLQAPARPHLRRLRAGRLRPVRHRGHVRPAGLPPPPARGRDRPACCIRWRCSPSAAMSSAPTRWARRSG